MIGQTIAHFHVLEQLGGGGMGVVYLAEDKRLDRKVALKFLPPHLSTDDEARQRFVQEAKAASALNHANICTVHDIGQTDDGQTFIAMAHYEGEKSGSRIDTSL
jgi:serine/threonine protein kinase